MEMITCSLVDAEPITAADLIQGAGFILNKRQQENKQHVENIVTSNSVNSGFILTKSEFIFGTNREGFIGV